MKKLDKSKNVVFAEVFNIVKNSSSIKLPDLQTILFKKYFLKKNNSDFLNEKIVIEAYNKAILKLGDLHGGK